AKLQLGIINSQNTDKRWFEACFKAYLASEKAHKQELEQETLMILDLKPDSNSIENNIINKKTIKLQKQKPNSYSYALIQTNGKFAKEIVRHTTNLIAES
ncbi:46338_t:CDS:2, partial [Gigaspora margarita]